MLTLNDGLIHLTETEFAAMYTYIRDKYAVNLEKKQFLIESKLARELARTNSRSYAEYWQRVRQDRTGQLEQRMIDLLTTNYSFFCRESDHFQYLLDVVLPELTARRVRQLSIWCAACADGQECYTLAMTLLDAADRGQLSIPFTILGTDISQTCLKTARVARYSAAEYARLPLSWQKKYCTPLQDGTFTLLEPVRSAVVFTQHNLMEPLHTAAVFHAVFCRNVMIYFQERDRVRLLAHVHRRMAEGGYLFLGHTESVWNCYPQLDYVRPSIYRRKDGSHA